MNEDRQFQSSVFRFCLLSSVDDVLGSNDHVRVKILKIGLDIL